MRPSSCPRQGAAHAWGTLSNLVPETIEALNKMLPPTWSHGNPVDIIGDAGPDRYRAALEAVLRDRNTDAVLVMNCPTPLASSVDAAKATVEAVESERRLGHKKPVIATWLAQSKVEEVRPLFAKGNIPDFGTPTEAIEGIKQLARYARAQTELMRTPPVMPVEHFNPEIVNASIAKALAQGRVVITEPEAKAVLNAYGIPTVPTEVASTPEEAAKEAAKLLRGHASVVVKILSRDIKHKSDIGGVRLDLTFAEEVEKATRRMLSAVKAARPDAVIEGVTVQPMIHRKDAYELILGITTDTTFGPIILFRAAGTGVETIGDTAMSLTPLDLKLASELIEIDPRLQAAERVPGSARRRFEGARTLPCEIEHARRATPRHSRARYQSPSHR